MHNATGWADGQRVPVADMTGQRAGAGEAPEGRRKRPHPKHLPTWERIFRAAIDLQCLHPPDRKEGEDEAAYAARFDVWWWALWDSWRVQSRNQFARLMKEGWPAYQMVFTDLAAASPRGFAFRAELYVYLPGTGHPGKHGGDKPNIWYASMRKHAHRVRPHDTSQHGQRGADLHTRPCGPHNRRGRRWMPGSARGTRIRIPKPSFTGSVRWWPSMRTGPSRASMSTKPALRT